MRERKSAPAASATEIFRLLVDGARDGRRGVLVTLIGLTGTGARAVGTHIAVLDSGESAGSFSSGCVEVAIVAEALDVLHGGASRVVRFGQDSPYIDIRLPCGGGMDVLFVPEPTLNVVEKALACLEARQPVALQLKDGDRVGIALHFAAQSSKGQGDTLVVEHAPPLRLVLLGHGAEMLTSLELGSSFGASIELYSPEASVVKAGLARGLRSVRLTSASDPMDLRGDPWTAFLFLFHDHDWEPPLIAKALEATSFWVGAMGSRRSHQVRQGLLSAYGISDDAIARVRGPVGLIPSARDPATLALSALAEIVSTYRALLP